MGSSALPEDGAGEIKPSDIEGWYTPIEACAYAANCVGTKGASNAVWRLLEAGLIEAVANSASRTPKDSAPIVRTKPVRIPERFWKAFTDHGSDLWNGGYARFWVSNKNSGTTFQYFGIKLNPDDVHANLPEPRHQPEAPQATSPVPAAEETANKGGRPRKEWWDDFWIEICRQIYEGDLKPKTQAELEKAMVEWVENHRNAEVGETTIKAAARKLFKAWGLGSKT